MADRPGSIQYGIIDFNTAGAHIIAAVPSEYSMLLINMSLSADGNEIVHFQDDTAILMGPYQMGNQTNIVFPDSEGGWCKTGDNGDFDIYLTTGGVRVSGSIAYRLIPSHLEL